MPRILLALAAVAMLPAVASAQSPAASAAPGGFGGLSGPVVPGVCMLSREAVFTGAKVGQAAAARLRVLTEDAQTEVNGERAKIEADAKTLEGQKASLSEAQFQAKQAAFAPRMAAIQQKAQLRSREIEATRSKVADQIAEQAQPFVTQAYESHRCGMLLNRDGVLGGNASADLTPSVIQGLDGKVTTITFDRETLTAPSPAGAAKR